MEPGHAARRFHIGAASQALQNAMGIALYAMFIALIIPAARKSVAVLCVIGAAVAVTCILKYIPVFGFISSGFRVILATIAASALGARLFPSDEYGEEKEDGRRVRAAARNNRRGGEF